MDAPSQQGVRPPSAHPSGRFSIPDEEEGALVAPSGALRAEPGSTLSGAPSSRHGGGGGFGDAGGDSDDDAVEASQSPFSVWGGLFVRLLFSLASTLVSVLLFVLYPVYCFVPRAVLEGLFRGLFRVGYLIYLTPVGAWLHSRGVKPNTPPHSLPVPPTPLSTATVTVVPILDNNYAYLLVDTATRAAAVVDPADPYAVVRAVQAANVTLTHILTTHHHHDHAGGNLELVRYVRAAEGRQLVVVGGRRDSVPGCTLAVGDGETLRVGATTLRVLETPCHTRGHVLFCVLSGPVAPLPPGAQAAHAPAPGCCGLAGSPAAAGPFSLPPARDADVEAVFSGDTVFIGGVGAFFHGDAADMERNLSGRMAGLPDAALLFCGHEYTADNMRFAAWLEPDNLDVAAKFLTVSARRAAGEPTVPSSMGAERRTNPYFRAADPALQAAAAARAAWVQRRKGRSWTQRTWDSFTGNGGRSSSSSSSGGGSGRAPPPAAGSAAAARARNGAGSSASGRAKPAPVVPSMTPVQLYRTLQELLSAGAWQSFKLSPAAAGAVRRRAAAANIAQQQAHQAAAAASVRAHAMAQAAAAAQADRAAAERVG